MRIGASFPFMVIGDFLQRRGQGAFEYILMLSGVIMIVVLILLILQGSISATNNTLAGNQNKFGETIEIKFVSHRAPNLYVAEATGGISNPPCCANQDPAGVRCEGPYGAAATAACNGNLTCSSKYFNNATGTCG